MGEGPLSDVSGAILKGGSVEEVVEKSVGVVEGPSEENVVEGISVGVLDSVGVTARPSIGV